MAEGAILHGMVHGREDFGFSVKIEERHNLFDMMGDVDLGAAHSLKVVVCHITQGQESITIFKEDGVWFSLEEPFAVARVLHEGVFFLSPMMACDELSFVIDGDELVIGFKGKGA